MFLNSIQPAEGAKHSSKRVGRGIGSGLGKTCGRGHKGQNSRSGGGVRRGFEGGQMPLQRRVPKFGFKNINRVEYSVMNLDDIQKLIDDKKILETSIDKEYLLKNKLLKGKNKPLKILGNGEITTKLDITADAFSKTAIEKIEKAGGKAVKL